MSFIRWQGAHRSTSNGTPVDRRRLPSDASAPTVARDALDQLKDRLSPDVLERAKAATSELVTNAVCHGSGADAMLEFWVAEGAVDIVVRDGGPGFTPGSSPTPLDAPGGVGLQLVDMLGDAWGCGADGGSWVWVRVSPRETGSDVRVAVEPELGLLDVRMLVDSVKAMALIALDPSGRIASWGSAAEKLTGYTAEEFLGRRLSDLYAPSVGSALARDLETATATGADRHDRWIRRKDGVQLCVSTVIAPIADSTSTLRGFSAVLTDVTPARERERKRDSLIHDLRELSLTDELTGLPNRRRWDDELGRELGRARRYGKEMSLAMLDLDGFKSYNDTAGHPAGDALLRSVAKAWAEAVRTTDLLARYGGDEFAAILPDCPPDEALEVIDRLRLSTPKPVTCSAGIAWSDGSHSPEELVTRADQALYRAKRAGSGSLLATDG